MHPDAIVLAAELAVIAAALLAGWRYERQQRKDRDGR